MTFLRERAVVPACVNEDDSAFDGVGGGTARFRGVGSTASDPLDGVSDSRLKKAAFVPRAFTRRTGELVLEVPGRLAVAHHHDRGLLARALAQRALRGAEQHDATLWSLELRLLRALRLQAPVLVVKRA